MLGASLVLCDFDLGKRQEGFVHVLRTGLLVSVEDMASMGGLLVGVVKGGHQVV